MLQEHQRFIDIEEPWECGYWDARLGVILPQLTEAVQAVGSSVAEVQRFLVTPKPRD